MTSIQIPTLLLTEPQFLYFYSEGCGRDTILSVMQIKCCNICIHSSRPCNSYEKYLAHGSCLANVALLSDSVQRVILKHYHVLQARYVLGNLRTDATQILGLVSCKSLGPVPAFGLSWSWWGCPGAQIGKHSDTVICPKLHDSWFTPWQWFQSGRIQPFETDNLRLLLISLCLILFYIPTDKYII